MLIEKENKEIPVSRQAELLGISRSTIYYEPSVDLYEVKLMELIDKIYTKSPFYGSRRISEELNKMGHNINRKRVQRLMRIMGIEAIYPKPNISEANSEHKIYPYLLRDMDISRTNQVWGTDITYIRLLKGWLYLVAIMDWYSRYVISWELSNSLEIDFCLRALEKALSVCNPEIFNSDQGSQFTSIEFTSVLKGKNIQISMDGKGRAIDNIFIERLWRSLKYEEIYIKDYQDVKEARAGIEKYLNFYNNERLHQSLEYKTPAEIYFSKYNLNYKTKEVFHKN